MGALAHDRLCEKASSVKKRKSTTHKIVGQFAPRTVSMLRSPAMRALSLSGRRILDRIEIELASHGGRDNAKLPVTFCDFEQYGIDRHAIGPGIREACVLGFVELTRRGRAGNGEFRAPNLFRLTYLPAHGKSPTHEWRRIETVEEAEKIARKGRAGTVKKRARKNILPVGETHTGPVGENPPATSGGKPTETPISPVGENPPLSRQVSSHLPERGLSAGHRLSAQPQSGFTPRRPGGVGAPVPFHRNRRRNSNGKK